MDHALIQETLKLDQMTLLCKQIIVTYPMLEAASWKTYQDVKKQVESLVCCALSPFTSFQLHVAPWTVGPRLLCPWGYPGKNTEVGCHALLQGIFPTWGSNLYLLCLLPAM